MYRTASRDVEMHGKVIKEGEQIGLTFAAANRDPRKFENPHRFDIRRDFGKTRHLAFGLGPHFCLGAALARMEVRLSLEEMIRRVRSIAPIPGQDATYLSSSFIRASRHSPQP